MQQNNYPNPLDDYSTYSIHYILTVSSSTESFREMIGSSGGSEPAPLLGAVQQVKALGDKINFPSSSAYLLVDTRRFSQYSIDSLTMDHLYGSGDPNNPTVPVNTTHLRIIDTTGFSFMNLLMDLFMNKLQTTRGSAFFMLAVMFVGHKADGSSETISNCFIPLMLLTHGIKIDHKGAVFEIDFMELEGAPRQGAPLEIMDSLTNISAIKSDRPTIGGMLESLEKRLNVQSLNFYRKYAADVYAGGANGDTLKVGKLVQYMITLYPEWSGYLTDLLPKSQNAEQNFVSSKPIAQGASSSGSGVGGSGATSPRPVETQLSFGPITTITDAISLILKSSTQFVSLASKERVSAGTAIAFRTLMTVTSDDTSFVIHFDIVPYFLPKEAGTDQLNAGSKNIIGPQVAVKNLLKYSYLFTGLNSHIMDLRLEYLPESAFVLDTNISLGRNRFKENASAGQVASNAALVGSSQEKRTSSENKIIRAGDPIFPPIKSKDQQQNANSQRTESLTQEEAVNAFKAQQEFTDTYAFLHFMSSLDLDLTIRGNPNLLAKYSDRQRRGIPPHYKIIDSTAVMKLVTTVLTTKSPDQVYEENLAGALSTAKSKYYDSYIKPRVDSFERALVYGADAVLDGPDVAVHPMFCELDIRMPEVNYLGDFANGNQLYTNKFFFDKPYMILTMSTNIDRGEFTQTLSMIPYLVDDSLSSSVEPSKPNTLKA